MEYKQIQDLLKLVNRLELTEFKMRDGDFELSIRTKRYDKTRQIVTSAPQVLPVQQAQAPVAPSNASPVQQNEESEPQGDFADQGQSATEDTSKLVAIKSPIVGTFYRSSSPDKPPYIKVGDTVAQGDVVCIVEAMKLFNEIESEVSGKVVKVVVEDATPVEYDQVLFLLDPNA